MRNLILKTTACLFAILFFASCSKEGNNDQEEEGLTTGTFLTASVDGKDFNAKENPLFAVTENVSGISTTVIVTEDQDDSNELALSIFNLNGTGTYTLLTETDDIETSSYIPFFRYASSNNVEASAAIAALTNTSATISITEFSDEYIAGSFSFTAYNVANDTTVTITEGEFRTRRVITNIP